MPAEAHISLADSIVVVFAGLALIVTLVLAVIGFRAASEFTSSQKRIRAIETYLKNEKEHYYGVNTLTEISYELFVSVVALLDLQRRAVEDLLSSSLASTISRATDAHRFRDACKGPLEKVLRLSLYLQVMTNTGETAGEFAAALVSHYPDYSTVDFLRALAHTREDVAKDLLVANAATLEAHLRRSK